MIVFLALQTENKTKQNADASVLLGMFQRHKERKEMNRKGKKGEEIKYCFTLQQFKERLSFSLFQRKREIKKGKGRKGKGRKGKEI
jgi:hypothetical protein